MSDLFLPALAPGHGDVATPLSVLAARTKRLQSQSYKLLDAPTTEGMTYGLDVPLAASGHDLNKMSVWITYADGNRRDQTGDLLEIGGIDLSRHRTNPIVLFDHGKQVVLPIALAEDPATGAYTNLIDPLTKVAKVNAFFYQGKTVKGISGKKAKEHAELCEQLYDLIVNKYVRAGSIGYIVKSADHFHPYERDAKGQPVGLHLMEVLMLEASAVVQPMNQDTVSKELIREVLAKPLICGKPLCQPLYKSLSGHVPANTTETVSVPHGDFTATDIPPPSSRQSWLDSGVSPENLKKSQDFLSRLTGCCQTFSDTEGAQDWVNRIFANPIDRHVYWVGDNQKGIDALKKHIKDIGVAKLTLCSQFPEGDGWKVWTKGSYFENCPRDATGHCVPEGAKPQTDAKPGAKPAEGASEDKRPSGSTSKKPGDRSNPQSGKGEQVWAKGKLGVLVRDGTVLKSGDPSIKIGQQVTDDFMVQNGWRKVEPKATPASGTEGKHMAAATKPKTKALPPDDKKGDDPDKPKQLPPNAPADDAGGDAPPPDDKGAPTDDVPLTDDPSMDAPVDPDADMATQDDVAVDVDPEMAEEPGEPYGAQYMRQVYEDFQKLIEDYHKMMGPLDNERILRWGEKKMALIDKMMMEMEAIFQQTYGGRGLRDLGAMDEMAPDMAMNGLDGPDGAAGDAPVGGPPGGDPSGASSEGEADPMDDDPGTTADSDPLERPEAEEVAQNMKRPDLKAIRETYRKKALSCKDCGKTDCKCSHTKAYPGKPDSGEPNESMPPVTDVTATHEKPTYPGKSADAFTEVEEPGHKELDDREKGWVTKSIAFLKSIAEEGKSFGEDERLESKGWHKLMDEVGEDYSAHFKKPGSKDHHLPDETETLPLRHLCKMAGDFLNAMSREKAFGLFHKHHAANFAKALEEALVKFADPPEPPAPKPPEPANPFDDGSHEAVDLSNIKSIGDSRDKQLDYIAEQIAAINSYFALN